MKQLIGRRNALKPSPVFDTYWRFAAARQRIFERRVAGHPPPWTDDAILSNHRFTNVYRASDRVSQFLIREVAYAGPQDPDELLFRVVLFKLFNKIETWKYLEEQLGTISWEEFDIGLYDRLLGAAKNRGHSIYSAAYIMPSPNLGAPRKHTNHLRLLEQMMREHLANRIAEAKSLEDVYTLFYAYPSIGPFLAFQLTIDVNYTSIIDFSEMDFVVAGPGAKDGIRKCFCDIGDYSEEDVIRAVSDAAEREFDRLELSFSGLWGRPLQLIDCQNLFCEVGKYARVVHPDVRGHSQRTRIKQKYVPVPRPIPQWYPPAWNLRVSDSGGPPANRVTACTPVQELLWA
jgi:hypothetical protein